MSGLQWIAPANGKPGYWVTAAAKPAAPTVPQFNPGLPPSPVNATNVFFLLGPEGHKVKG